jgi:hypothetical protein
MLPALSERLEAHRLIKAGTSTMSLMLLVGIRDPSVLSRLTMLPGLPPSKEEARRIEAARSTLLMLERDGRGPFVDPRRAQLGRPLSELYSIDEPCSGRIDLWQEIGSEGTPGVKVQGIVRETPDALAPVSILVADPEGVIRGLGNVLPEREGRFGWVAFLGAHAPERRHDVYAELENGSVCLLHRHRAGRRSAERSVWPK